MFFLSTYSINIIFACNYFSFFLDYLWTTPTRVSRFDYASNILFTSIPMLWYNLANASMIMLTFSLYCLWCSSNLNSDINLFSLLFPIELAQNLLRVSRFLCILGTLWTWNIKLSHRITKSSSNVHLDVYKLILVSAVYLPQNFFVL